MVQRCVVDELKNIKLMFLKMESNWLLGKTIMLFKSH